MLSRSPENTVRPRNLQDPHVYLEEGIPLEPHLHQHQEHQHQHQYQHRSSRRTQEHVPHDLREADDNEEMYEKTHIRQRSGYLSPTLGTFPLPGNSGGQDDMGTRHRKTAARVDQSTNETGVGSGDAAGLGQGLGLGLETKREKDGQVVFERPKQESSGRVESAGLTGKDRKAFILLVMLYLLQGIPIGLTFGTIPFLLKPHVSYSQLALFSLSSWPYSLKLLYSPIVDAWFWNRLGRRKSWIVPVQIVLALTMWVVGGRVQGWIDAEEIDVHFLTFVFVMFIFFAATQDIAVDGWALTLLSGPNLSYASTAQTIGLTIGSTLSNTVFLALNSVEFSNTWLRSKPSLEPAITLEGYLKFWAGVYLVFTTWLIFGQKEEPTSDDDPDLDVRKVYTVMGSILKLKNIQSFLAVHLVAKFGFQALESSAYKFMEKGLRAEDFAAIHLLNTPFELLGASVAAKWSRGDRPLNAWQQAFWPRYAIAAAVMLLFYVFPKGHVGPGYMGAFIAITLMGSFASTVQFVGVTAFHTQIADPLIGGTYMTLLNTVTNLGGTWPKPVVLKGIDYFSRSSCRIKEASGEISLRAAECISDHGRALCAQEGGVCVTERDGFYAMSMICIVVGVTVLVMFVLPTTRRLQNLPMSAWRVKIPA